MLLQIFTKFKKITWNCA